MAMARLSAAINELLLMTRNVYSQDPRLSKWRKDFEALMLSERDVRRLYCTFRRVDVDSGGTIDLLELLMFLDIERTPFNMQVFSIMDEDNSGCIDFKEFVVSLWNYCTLGDEALALFAFDVYDNDCSSELEIHEVGNMLKNLYGSKFESNPRAQKLHKQMKVNPHLKFGPAEFRNYARCHPALFFPAFEMQNILRTKVLGKSFWRSHANKRISTHGPELRLRDVLSIHTKPNTDTVAMDASVLPLLRNILKITNTREHRAEKRKEQKFEDSRAQRYTAETEESRQKKREKKLDEIINKCTNPDMRGGSLTDDTPASPSKQAGHRREHPNLSIQTDDVAKPCVPTVQSVGDQQWTPSKSPTKEIKSAATKKKIELDAKMENKGNGNKKRRATLASVGGVGVTKVSPAVDDQMLDVPAEYHPVLGYKLDTPNKSKQKRRVSV